MKVVLTRYGLEECDHEPADLPKRLPAAVRKPLAATLERRGLELVRRRHIDPEIRAVGKDWPPPRTAETMVGLKRLDNLEALITTVHDEGVPGDLVEAGVWRGGAAIFMKAVLLALGDQERTVWLADSFQGLPPPDAEKYPVDAGDRHHTHDVLRVTRQDVEANFRRYGLLDSRVRFLEGWFAETLPTAPISKIAVMRLDGDMYGSTMESLAALYPRLSVGGFVVIDDYANPDIAGARAATDDFRSQHGINEPIEIVDWTGVYWRRR
jgi:O-methyltransferase